MTFLKSTSSDKPLKLPAQNRLIGFWMAFFWVLLTPFAGWASQAPSQQKILVVGDSLSAGYGVAQGEEWVQLLANRLAESGASIGVVNASISGDTSAGGVSRLPSLLQSHNPTWVVIELGANDGLRGLSLKSMEQNLQTMIDMVRNSGAEAILIGILIPPNYGKKYTDRFALVYQNLAQKNTVPLLPFLLEGVAGNDAYMQADRLHPNADAQPLIEAHVWRFLGPILENSD